MSGSNPLMAPGVNLNALQTQQENAPPPPAAPQQPQGMDPQHVQHFVAGAMRGMSQDKAIQRREASGAELDLLAKIANDPDPKPDEIHDYLFSAIKAGQIPAGDAMKIIQSIPGDDPDMLKTWAKNMFGLIAHQAVHLHAAYPREAFPAPEPEPAGEPEQPS